MTSFERRKRDIEAIAALTALQQGILVHSLESGEHDPYFHHWVFELRGELDVAALERSWQFAADRHQALRADLRWEEASTPLQVIYETRPVRVQRVDLRGLAPERQLAALRERLGEERRRGFDFRQAADLKLALLELDDARHWFCWSVHHVALDGWSVALVLRDLLRAYRQIVRGEPPSAAPPVPLVAYVEWLSKQDQAEAAAYFERLLAGVEGSTPLPVVAAPQTDPRSGERRVLLDAALTARLRHAARNINVTLNTLVQGAWALLLARHGGVSDVVFGATVSGRSPAFSGAGELAGLLINTLPVRATLRASDSVRSWLSALQAQNAETRRHEHMPLALLNAAAGGELVSSLVVFENYPIEEQLGDITDQLSIQRLPRELLSDDGVHSTGRNNYPLTLNVVPGERLALTVVYQRRWFSHADGERLGAQLRHLLANLAEHPERQIGSIGLGFDEEPVPDTPARAARPVPLLEAFFEHARVRAEAPCLQEEQRRIGFGDVGAAAERLAARLRALGVRREARVALICERSIDFVIGILGVWRAGGAHVPLDPALPPARMRQLVDASGAGWLLCSAELRARAAALETLPPLVISDAGQAELPAAWPEIHPEQAAYVIFTSGSTGEPKGVVVSHGALARYVAGVLQRFELEPEASLAMVSTPAADLGHTTLFGALYSGRCLHLIRPERAFDPHRFAEYMRANGVGVLKVVPSHIKGLLEAGPDALPRHALILGGEASEPALIDAIRRAAPGCRLFNHYGPTETTVGAVSYELLDQGFVGRTLPIGRPLPQARAYVLDADLNRLPRGVPGELYVGGDALARGYLERPGASAERFLPDPHAPHAGARMYRTGDRVVLRDDGQLEFLGRNDHQVKLRGYRIELGEIDAMLLRHPEVRAAVTTARELGGSTALVAYVVPRGPSDALESELSAWLRGALPEAMVPSHFVFLERLPLNANGKVDRKKLPEPDAPARREPAAPSTPTERALCEIWREVLRTPNLGVTDDFFALGGDSILSLQIIARARKRGLRVTPRQIFETPSIRELARVVQPVESRPPPPTGDAPDLPLTPVQSRFFEANLEQPQRFSQSLLLEAVKPLEPERLGLALERLVSRHDALRSRFRPEGGRVLQRTLSVEAAQAECRRDPLLWREAASGRLAQLEQAERARQSLHLERGPLLRAVWFEGGQGQSLLLVVHHLAIDAVSWRVLVEDLEASYQALAEGSEERAAPATRFADWARHLANAAQRPELRDELSYWEDELGAAGLASEWLEPAEAGSGLARREPPVSLTLPRPLTRQLLASAPAAYRTMVNDLLLTALARAACRLAGSEGVLIELEGHGREDASGELDLSQTVGWFTTHFPVALRPVAGDLGASIQAIKEQLRRVPRRGLGHGLARYLGDAGARARIEALPQPRLTFNYLGQLELGAERSALFELADERLEGEPAAAGSFRRALDLLGEVRAGELSFRCRFDATLYRRDSVLQFMRAFAAELEAIAQHCCRPDVGGLTPSDVPLAGLSQAQLDALPIAARDIEDIYPLAPLQQGLLFHSLEAEDSGVYVSQLRWTMQGLDEARFEDAWRAALRRHAVLRTAIVWAKGAELPVQVVLRDVELGLGRIDLSERPDAARAFDELCVEQHTCPFQLDRAPLQRVALVRLPGGEHGVIWTRHHLLMDGWSSARLLEELLAAYGGSPPGANAGRYRDHIEWLARLDAEASRRFWSGELRRLDGPTLLSRCLPGRGEGKGHGLVASHFDSRETRALERFAARQRVTLSLLLQAAWTLLLQRYTGQSAVVFGATVSGRSSGLPGIESTLGLFINTVPVIHAARAAQPVGAWLNELMARQLELAAHEHTPLHDIQRWAGQAGRPLFDTLLVFENYPVDASVRQQARADLVVRDASVVDPTSYALTLSMQAAEHLSIEYSYRRADFAAADIERIEAQMRQLLAELVQSSERPLGTIDGLTRREREQLAGFARAPFAPLGKAVAPGWAERVAQLGAEWQAEPAARALRHGYAGLFERQCLQTPERVAASASGDAIGCGELRQRAARLGRCLAEAGVLPDEVVAVFSNRNLEWLELTLGVLWAGAAHLPLDPRQPLPRLAQMLGESRARWLLVESGLATPARELLALRPGLRLIETGAARLAGDGMPPRPVHGESLAYVLFTSGSTGVPKGAQVHQRGMLNNQLSKIPLLGLDAADTIAQTAPQSFDICVWQLLTGLVCGARVEIVPDEVVADPRRLIAHANRTGITVLETVPALIAALLDVTDERFESLRVLLTTGEAMPSELARRFLERYPEVALVNAYGPAECSDDVALHHVHEPPPEGAAPLAIGRPGPQLRLHVLDPSLRPVPVGVTGEIYVSGIGVGRGYVHDPAKTAGVFIPHPLGERPGERAYRTGDLGRYRADGVLEYAGRRDQQVKIHGQRLELGEVEARLAEHPAVQRAVVLTRDAQDGRRLVAYVVPAANAARPDARELQAHLERLLPRYMVPAHIAIIERVPLTPNGKLDRSALPDPTWTGASYVAPANDLERVLAELWQSALAVPRVGRLDDFFELGGDSIVALRVVHLARQRGLQLSPRQLFENPTPAALAAVARAADANTRARPAAQGAVPLTPIQEWFFARRTAHPEHYNQALVLRPTERLRPAELGEALEAVLAHHDALRLRFRCEAGTWSQEYAPRTTSQQHEAGQAILWLHEAEHASEVASAGERAQRSLDLERGPLLRAVLVQLPDGEQRLVIAVHHLVVDGVSWRILAEDLENAYRQRRAGQPGVLPAATDSFKAWAERLVEFANGPALAEQRACWAPLEAGGDAGDWPRDTPDSEARFEHAVTLTAALNAAETRALQSAAPVYRLRLDELSLTALARALCAWSQRASVAIELEGHGRGDLFEELDVSRTVGWFTSLFPVVLTPVLGDSDAAARASLIAIKEQLRGVPFGGLGYGAARFLAAPELRRELERLPPARVTFNYLGQLDELRPGALFVRTRESAGQGQSPDGPLDNWLTVHARLEGSELTLGCTFSEAMYRRETIAALLADFRRELSRLAEHCAAHPAGALTPSDFPLARLSQAQLDALPLLAREVEDMYPLSPMQQGMLFHGLYSPDSDVYVNQLTVDLTGLDVGRFHMAWRAMSERHRILRTSFLWQSPLREPLQVVHRELPLAVEAVDASAGRLDDAQLAALVAAERERVKQLERAPLHRALLIQLDADRRRLVWTHHHLLLDGWSAARFLQELLAAYAGRPLAPTAGRYADYIRWLSSKSSRDGQLFWKDALGQLSEPTLLTRALRGPSLAEQGSGRQLVLRRIADDVCERLESFARYERVTLNTVVQAAWLLLLARYTGQRAVACGATVAGRPAEVSGVDELLGLFINTLPVAQTVRFEQSVGDWLRQLQAYNLSLREHEHTPLYDVQRHGPEPGQALFDTLLVFDNHPVERALQAASSVGLSFGEPATQDAAHYALALSVQRAASLNLRFDYDSALLSERSLQAISSHLEQLLIELCVSGSRALGKVQMLTASERGPLSLGGATTALGQRGALGAAYASQLGCLHQRIEARAADQPSALAVVLGEESLTYAELNERANRLAWRLRQAQVGPDVLVGLCLERSLDLIVGMLAILKAGGAYVPIDPRYPQERIAYLIEDSGIRLLLTQSAVLEGLPALRVSAWCLDRSDAAAWRADNPPNLTHPDHLAYCIYTSGSTGKPKGALITHRNVVRLFDTSNDSFRFDAGDVWTLFHSAAFDFSVWEIFGALLYGGRLVIVPYYVSRSPGELLQLLVAERVTVLSQTPSAFKQLIALPELEAADRELALRYVIFGGEALDATALAPWFARFGDQRPRLVNMYGITETTVHVTYRPLTARDAEQQSAGIGHALGDLTCFTLDRALDLAPAGVLGELHVGGAGLARGYHRRPGLTAQRFVPNPFAEHPGERLYRSGDLGRRRPQADGELEYCGRIDHQVKVRGFRIELGEIESALRQHPAVRDALVLARRGAQGPELVGYAVVPPAEARAPIGVRLRQHLEARLPEYMLPAHLVVLDRMPLTENGKLDRRALPDPSSSAQRSPFVAPVSETERQIASIWQDVLAVDQVGRSDDFFELGGHSLLATRVIARIRHELQSSVPLSDLFEARCLGQFAARVEQRRGGSERAQVLSQLEALLDEVEAS